MGSFSSLPEMQLSSRIYHPCFHFYQSRYKHLLQNTCTFCSRKQCLHKCHYSFTSRIFFMCVMLVYVVVRACTYVEARSMFNVFFSCCPPDILRQDLLLSLAPTNLSRLATMTQGSACLHDSGFFRWLWEH